MKQIISAILAMTLASHVSASVLTEDFSDVPGWESQWFGIHSNAKNYYQVKSGTPASYRGNNPDGLWLDDNDGVNDDNALTIRFDDVFASSLSSFSLDLASYLNLDLKFFDALGNDLSTLAVTPTFGGTQMPGVYRNFAISSTTGIGGFSLLNTGSTIEGNLSLDNLVAVVNDMPSASVPEPASLILLALGAVGLIAQRRRLG